MVWMSWALLANLTMIKGARKVFAVRLLPGFAVYGK